MDSYDIFQKLTKGAYFNKRTIKRKAAKDSSGPIKVKLEEANIKDENVNAAIVKDEESDHSESSFMLLDDNGVIEKKRKKIDPKTKKESKENEETISLRKANRINVIGKNVPPPIVTFEELSEKYKVSKKLVKNLADCNYTHPTPIQMQAIPILLQGRPIMACAPTGSGKTVAFLTPIINDLKVPQKSGFRAIILCPTRELAKQTYRECVRLTERIGLRVHIISKVNQAEQKFGISSNKKFDILISTPNRVRYLLAQEPAILDLSSIEWVIIDEADRLMEEGENNFKDQFVDILKACTKSTKNIGLFSATCTVPVSKWAVKNLKGLVRVTIGEQNTATDLVNQELLFVGSESGKLLAFRDLVRNGLKPPVLVFVQSKDRAKQLFNELIYDGVNVDVIHADRTQLQRDNVVRAFREGKIWVLICTELMGRGIDFKGVNLVVNYDFPPSSIAYIHRIGRAGRAGRRGTSITYFTQEDTPNLRSIAQIIKNSGGKVPDFLLSLKKPKKSDKKKLANSAPKREFISTNPKFLQAQQDKLQEVGKYVKIAKGSDRNFKEKISKTDERIEKNDPKTI